MEEDCKNLPQSKTVQFHNLVAKTLYATKGSRPDTCTAVAFLTPRNWAPDWENWANMVHMMRYIRGTRTLPLILSANGSGILKWWVDTSFDVHPNMQGHSGGGFSLGPRFPIVSSTKQKTQHPQIYRDWTGRRWWLHAGNLLDTVFFEGLRIQNLGERFVSGKQEMYYFG